MVPDDEYPPSPWQTVALVFVCVVVFGLAIWGGIDLAIRATAWLPVG